MSYEYVFILFSLFIITYSKIEITKEKASSEIISDNSEQKNETIFSYIDLYNIIKNKKQPEFGLFDMNNYLSKNYLKAGEKYLEYFYDTYGVSIYIFFIPHIELTNDINDIRDYTDKLIQLIYSNNSNAILPKNASSIFVVLSIDDKIMTMQEINKISLYISNSDGLNIMNQMNNYLPFRQYDKGLEHLILMIKFYIENPSYISRYGKNIIIIILLALLLLYCYYFSYRRINNNNENSNQLSLNDKEKLEKIKEFLKNLKQNKKILCENCIICLEPFDNCESLNQSKELIEDNNGNNDRVNDVQLDINNSNNKEIIDNHLENNIIIEENENEIKNQNIDEIENNNDNSKITTLPCGHRFHFRCISEWFLKRNGTCPVCREKLPLSLPENQNEDFSSEIINIQRDLHPAFALLVFETVNQELTWGFAAPAVGAGWLAGIFGVGAGGFAFV